MAVRDSFSQATKTNLAKRAAYMCSCPDCRAFTLGPKKDVTGIVNIGVAAHITAAAAGGPRFDASIHVADRVAEQNGIWLCANCHTRVDADPNHFTVAKLCEWKRQAEARSFEQLGRRPADLEQAVSFQPKIVAYDYEILKEALASKGHSVDEAVESWRQAASKDVADFKALRSWPISPITLSLRSTVGEDEQIPQFAMALELATDVVIASPPGTGKSTTLVQLADAILAAGRRVAIYVPLPQWGAQQAELLPSMLGRGPYSHLDLDALRLLAAEGRLVLLLDGWNELDTAQRKRLRLQLQQLRREYPLLVLVVATRALMDQPIEAPAYYIEALSEGEQREVARRMRGEDGVAVLDAAWRVEGLRDLVAIPLFLTALLERAVGASLPRSKDEILEGYVRAQTRDDARGDSLREELEDMAFCYLEALAREMRENQQVLFEAGRARSIVANTGAALILAGQIGAAPLPGRTLDILSDLHLLERPNDGAMVQFQHQQIQEWFASRDVESAIRAAAAGDAAALTWLRSSVMNWRHWDETLFFAIERIGASDSPDALKLIALVVDEALRLDPILAAGIIAHAPDAFWAAVGPAIVKFATAWHKAGSVDRPVDFMITTGRPEFADLVWPLISAPDSQVHLPALRAGNSLRSSVLGSDVAARIAMTAPEVRGHILSELASNGGMDGIELATSLAEADPDREVRFQTYSALDFRSASRHAIRLLKASDEGVWDLVASRGYWTGIDDIEVTDRLETIRARQRAALTDPVARLHALLQEPEGAEPGPLRQILADADFPVNADRIYHLIDRLAARWPREVAASMEERLGKELALPFRAEALLALAPPRDDGSLIERVVNGPAGDGVAKAAARLAGPATVIILIEQALARRATLAQVAPEDVEKSRSAYWAAVDRVTSAPLGSFVEALTAFASETDPERINVIAEIMSRHSGVSEERPMALTEAQSLRMVSLIEGWAKALLGNTAATRTQVSALAVAIERVPREELLEILEALLVEDLERYQQQWEQFMARPSRHDHTRDMSMAYGLQFGRAFVAIGGERVVGILRKYLRLQRFGPDAAMALRRMFALRTGEAEKHFGQRWPDFSVLGPDRNRPEDSAPGPEADALHEGISILTSEGALVENRERALYLVKVMLGMPHADHPSIPQLMADEEISPLAKRDAMAAMAMTGATLSADVVRRGLEAFLKRAETDRWLLDADHTDLGRWLALLPFSDRPTDLFELLDALDPKLLTQRNLEEVCEALRWAPTGVGDVDLVKLLKRMPDLWRDSTWQAALLERPEETAFAAFCDALERGELVRDREAYSAWSLGDRIAGKVARNAALRAPLLSRYRVSENGARHLYGQAISKLHDAENVLALIDCYAGWRDRFDGSLAETVRNCALSYQTSERMVGSQEIVPVDCTDLRKQLFDLVRDVPEKRALARECLDCIEHIRGDYGHIDTEPRHPDVNSGLAWPLDQEELPNLMSLAGTT